METNRIRILSRIDNPRVHALIHTHRIAGMLYSYTLCLSLGT